MSALPRVIVAEQSGRSLKATVVGTYDRKDLEGSTDGPTFRHMAAVIFQQAAAISRVVLLSSDGGQMLFVFEAAHRWFDVTGAVIEVKRA